MENNKYKYKKKHDDAKKKIIIKKNYFLNKIKYE